MSTSFNILLQSKALTVYLQRSNAVDREVYLLSFHLQPFNCKVDYILSLWAHYRLVSEVVEQTTCGLSKQLLNQQTHLRTFPQFGSVAVVSTTTSISLSRTKKLILNLLLYIFNSITSLYLERQHHKLLYGLDYFLSIAAPLHLVVELCERAADYPNLQDLTYVL